MSVQEDVINIINEAGVAELKEEQLSGVPSNRTVTEALLEVSTLLAATSGSLDIVCARVEAATSRASLWGPFGSLTKVWRC